MLRLVNVSSLPRVSFPTATVRAYAANRRQSALYGPTFRDLLLNC